jgi:hypothetical protein
MGKPKIPKPPSYKGVTKASRQSTKVNARLAQQQLQWAKKSYRKDKKTYNKLVDQYLSDMKTNSENAAEDRSFFEQNYRPLELDMIKDAKTYDSPERRMKEMGASQALVAEQFNSQRENAQQELESYGIDPSSARYGALDIGVRAAQAAAQAAAGTTASNRVEDVGRALRADAVNIGRGYGSSIAQTYATSHNAGAQAGALTGQRTQIGSQTMGTPVQYQGLANQGINTWGNLLHTQYQDQMAQYNAQAQQSSGIGSVLGMVAGIGTKAFGFAEGGAVPEMGIPDIEMQQGADGVYVDPTLSPTGGEQVDDVPARLNAGEFVIPDDVVQWYGQKHMYGLIEKAQKERSETLATTQAIPEIGPPLQQPPVLQTA